MFERLRVFWGDWKGTAIGKAVQDFFWTVLYSSIIAGFAAVLPVLAGGQTDPGVVWGLFSTGVSVAFLKSLSLFVDKYRNPTVPNQPI